MIAIFPALHLEFPWTTGRWTGMVMRLELRMAENDNELSVKLPEGLRRQFAQVERHLWRVETAIAVCIALCGLIASYLLLFISDRIWETPIWLRVSLTVLGVGTFLGAGYRWAWKWLWQRPDLRKLAKLVQKKYRRLGDRLLGIVELANEQKHLANFSPALYHAAIHQVAAEAEKFDFRESVSPRRAKKFISAAAILFAPLLLAALILPAASWNVFLRWLAPGAAITRYTLVTLEGFPDKLIVPHGETFELTGAVQYRSFWKPSRATGQYERQQKIEGPVQAGAFRLRVPGQVENGNLKIEVGDAERVVKILPSHRPSLKELAASIQLPEYLHYPDQTETIQNGSLLALEGSSVSFHGKISRALTAAQIQFDGGKSFPLKIHNEEFSSELAKLDGPQYFIFSWQDNIGLTNAAPLRLAVQTQKDAPPIPNLPELSRDVAMLATDVLQVKTQARDDYGVRDMGLMWEFFSDTPSTFSSAVTEVKIMTDSPHEKKAEKIFQWSPSLFRVPPDSTVELQAYARDYFPERERAKSPIYRIHVLSQEQHAEMLRQRLESLLARVEEVTRLQEKIVANTRDVKENQKIPDAEKSSRIGKSKDDQSQNAKNLDALAKEGENTLGEAMKNPTFTEDAMKDWTKTIQEMQKLAQQKMKEAAGSLKSAQQNSNSKSGKQDLAEALQKEEEILKALEKMQNKVNEDLDNLQALTLAQRLRKVGAQEKEISEQLQKSASETIGLLPAELPDKFKELDAGLAKQQDGAQKESQILQGEISRFFERTKKENYDKVSKEMKDSHTGDELDHLRGLIKENIAMEASGNLGIWSKRFNDWGDLLEPKQKSDGGGSGSGSGTKPIDMTKRLIALLRLREKEMTLHDQTGLLDEQKGDEANYKERASELFSMQKKLSEELNGIHEQTPYATLDQAFNDSADAMKGVKTLLQKPQTDKVTELAQTKTVEALSDLINLINEQAQRPNPQAGSGSSSPEEMAFLMKMMAQQKEGKGKPMKSPGGGNTMGGSTDRAATQTNGNARGRGAAERNVSKATGVIENSPTEFRDALENYFHAIEQKNN